jgi:hypothetical protein
MLVRLVARGNSHTAVTLTPWRDSLTVRFAGDVSSNADAGAKDTLATKRDLDAMRGEIAKLAGELRAEIHRAVGGSTRQMYLALLGHMAMTLGFLYFLMTQLR